MIQELTATEEAQLILLDVFNEDKEGEEHCLNILFEDFNISLDSEDKEKICNLIIEYEDDLHSMYNFYLNEPL
ncbi:hypothetical protein EBR43_07295 [bacterium]|jgi:hypothetical protein|nr:hypothetical protein [bacterium]